MKLIRLFFVAYFALCYFSGTNLEAQTYHELPVLNREQRSDWLNVKDLLSTANGGVSAKGDGLIVTYSEVEVYLLKLFI